MGTIGVKLAMRIMFAIGHAMRVSRCLTFIFFFVLYLSLVVESFTRVPTIENQTQFKTFLFCLFYQVSQHF